MYRGFFFRCLSAGMFWDAFIIVVVFFSSGHHLKLVRSVSVLILQIRTMAPNLAW